VPVDEHQASALVRQPLRDRQPEPVGRAGDDRDLSIQPVPHAHRTPSASSIPVAAGPTAPAMIASCLATILLSHSWSVSRYSAFSRTAVTSLSATCDGGIPFDSVACMRSRNSAPDDD